MLNFKRAYYSGLLMAVLLTACQPPLQTDLPITETPSLTTPAAAELASALAAVQAKAQLDADFAADLEENPQTLLQKEGVPLPVDQEVMVLAQGAQLYLVLDDRNLSSFHPDFAVLPDEAGELERQVLAIRTKAQTDADFKARLLKDSALTLTAEGMAPEVAQLFNVIDYQPKTQFLLIAGHEAAVSRTGSQGQRVKDNEKDTAAVHPERPSAPASAVGPYSKYIAIVAPYQAGQGLTRAQHDAAELAKVHQLLEADLLLPATPPQFKTQLAQDIRKTVTSVDALAEQLATLKAVFSMRCLSTRNIFACSASSLLK